MFSVVSVCLCVCLSVCLSVQAIAFKLLHIGTSFLGGRYILTISKFIPLQIIRTVHRQQYKRFITIALNRSLLLQSVRFESTMHFQLAMAHRDIKLKTITRGRSLFGHHCMFSLCHSQNIKFAGKLSQQSGECECLVPCERVRYEPNLSYAQLSQINLERLIIDSDEKAQRIEVCTIVFSFYFCSTMIYIIHF